MTSGATMSSPQVLQQWLELAFRRFSSRVAIEDQDGNTISYRDLDGLSGRVRDRLWHMGVRPGCRVGICCRKSIDAVAAILGVLRTGAAYVPCDPHAPASRNAYILGDCTVKIAIVEEQLVGSLQKELTSLDARSVILSIPGASDGTPLRVKLDEEQTRERAARMDTVFSEPDDLAYILYTSGSTGRPKGVMLSHRNAVSFVQWCSETFRPTPDERFSSHAPFHFDLSILDLYLPLRHGAAIVLIGNELGKDPGKLAEFIAQRRLTSWYSAPSILSLMTQFGKISAHDYSSLKRVLFAGEVFPVRYLRDLRTAIPHPRYFNLYGPTETNVCTYHEIPQSIPTDRTQPYPIGKVCSHLSARVVEPDGEDVPLGSEGELCIAGPAVTAGYWNLNEQTERAFLSGHQEQAWYRTGDIVVTDEAGDYLFRGRRDRMIKKRGYRVELGEIEACLYRCPSVYQAAVIAVDGPDGVRVKAFVCGQPGQRLSPLALKTFCSQHLPLYMVPDLFEFPQSMPTTSTDKIDYQQLKRWNSSAPVESPV
jgi:amino acid adenylation domain-containing protein